MPSSLGNICRQKSHTSIIQTIPNPEPVAENLGPWILAATIIGSGMVFIDGTVVNVALPELQADLNATVADVQWIVEAYALFLAALLLVGGALGDHYGRRRIYAIGTVIFALASVWSGLAATANQLILARSVQGIGGALLVPGSLAIIGAYFDDEQRGRAIGTWSAFSALTMALGPVLGGWLIENASWRWVFFINVPLALIVLIIVFWHVPESRDEEAPAALDWWGTGLATIGLGGLVYGLIESANLGLSHPLVFGALIVGVLGLAGFIVVEARSQAPMMPLNLFRSQTFSGANLLTLLLYGALGGALFFLPFNLIQVQDYSATAAGAAFLPFIIIIFLLSPWAGGLVDRFGAKRPLIIGPIIVAVGYFVFTLPGIGGSYWVTFFPPIALLGLGMAITAAPLTTAVMGAVETHHAGIASGVNNAVSRTAGLLVIAILGILVLVAFNTNLDNQLASLDLPAEAQQQLDEQRIKLAGAEVPATVSEEVRVALEQAIDESFVVSFRIAMFVAVGLALASALVAALMIEGKQPDVAQVPASAK
jgi:EmrB/QacA subfamily drug resistance transporter